MEPTAILKEEHRIIERLLKVLTHASEKLEGGEAIDMDVFHKALDFIRTFADKCHHAKEEDALFPLFEARGIPRHGGPLGVMLHEHEEGRSYVRAMAQALEKLKENGEGAKRAFARNARNYVWLLSNHIDKEDNILYPMGDERLSEEDRRDLVKKFQLVEERMGEGIHERYHHLVEELERGG